MQQVENSRPAATNAGTTNTRKVSRLPIDRQRAEFLQELSCAHQTGRPGVAGATTSPHRRIAPRRRRRALGRERRVVHVARAGARHARLRRGARAHQPHLPSDSRRAGLSVLPRAASAAAIAAAAAARCAGRSHPPDRDGRGARAGDEPALGRAGLERPQHHRVPRLLGDAAERTQPDRAALYTALVLQGSGAVREHGPPHPREAARPLQQRGRRPEVRIDDPPARECVTAVPSHLAFAGDQRRVLRAASLHPRAARRADVRELHLRAGRSSDASTGAVHALRRTHAPGDRQGARARTPQPGARRLGALRDQAARRRRCGLLAGFRAVPARRRGGRA